MHIRKAYASTVNFCYRETILVHPTRRQSFAWQIGLNFLQHHINSYLACFPSCYAFFRTHPVSVTVQPIIAVGITRHWRILTIPLVPYTLSIDYLRIDYLWKLILRQAILNRSAIRIDCRVDPIYFPIEVLNYSRPVFYITLSDSKHGQTLSGPSYWSDRTQEEPHGNWCGGWQGVGKRGVILYSSRITFLYQVEDYIYLCGSNSKHSHLRYLTFITHILGLFTV